MKTTFRGVVQIAARETEPMMYMNGKTVWCVNCNYHSADIYLGAPGNRLVLCYMCAVEIGTRVLHVADRIAPIALTAKRIRK